MSQSPLHRLITHVFTHQVRSTMGVSSRPSTAEVTQQQEQKPRIGRKRGVSRAQRDRWQLGTPTQSNPDSQRGPTGRSSFEADSMSGAVMRQQNADSMQVRIQPSRVDTAASDQPQRPAASGTAGSPSQSTKSDARAPGGAPPANRGDFGSTGDMAKLEQNISPFRKIQDHHASGSGRGEVAAHADGTTAAATTVRTDSVESESSNDSPRVRGFRNIPRPHTGLWSCDAALPLGSVQRTAIFLLPWGTCNASTRLDLRWCLSRCLPIGLPQRPPEVACQWCICSRRAGGSGGRACSRPQTAERRASPSNAKVATCMCGTS